MKTLLQRVSCAIFALVIFGCGSAMEYNSSINDSFQSSDQPMNLGSYEFLVDPVALTLEKVPSQENENPLAIHQLGQGALQQNITSNIVFGVGWNPGVFDASSNSIHMGISFSQNPSLAGVGTCIGHNYNSNYPLDVDMVISNISDPNVTFLDGPVGNAVSFGSLGSEAGEADGSCRPWSMQNTSLAYYQFHVDFIADSIAANKPDSFITSVDYTRFTYSAGPGLNVDVVGSGFTAGGSTNVFVNGAKVSTLDNTEDTLVEFNVSAVYSEGFLTVNNGTEVIQGPYITQPTSISLSGLRLPDGVSSKTSSLYMFAWNGLASLAASGCPNGFADSEVDRSYLMSTSVSPAYMWDVNFSGATRFQIIFDYNENGTPDTGDYYYLSGGSTLIAASRWNSIAAGTLSGQLTGDCGFAY